MRECIGCGKNIRANSKKAYYLGFIIATGEKEREAWVHNQKCEDRYNDEPSPDSFYWEGETDGDES